MMIAFLTVFFSHKTVAVSKAVKRDARFMPLQERKMVVIHNGVSEIDLKPRDEARASLLPEHEGKTWIGMIAELHPIKSIEDTIEAMARVREEFPNAILVVLGDGEERAKLERHIEERNLKGHVFLVGFVNDAARYAQAFDVFVVSSRSEGLAYVILEAGRAGVATVTTKVGGIPEIIEDNETGLLSPPQDPADLAERLLRILRDEKLREKLGNALRRKVEEKFSLNQMIEKTFNLYR
jgi:L-malate glycosyltransferase